MKSSRYEVRARQLVELRDLVARDGPFAKVDHGLMPIVVHDEDSPTTLRNPHGSGCVFRLVDVDLRQADVNLRFVESIKQKYQYIKPTVNK